MKTTKGSVYDSPMKMPTDEEISNAIRNDFEAFVPPASSKEEILKALNINGKVGKLAPTWYSRSLKRYGAVAAAGLALFVASYFGNNTENSPLDYNAPAKSAVETKISQPVTPQKHNNNICSVPMVSSVETKIDKNSNDRRSPFDAAQTLSSGSAEKQYTESIADNSNTLPASAEAQSQANIDNAQPENEHIYALRPYGNGEEKFSQPISASLYENTDEYGFITPHFRNSNGKAGVTLSIRGMAAENFASQPNFGSSLGNSFAVGVYTPISGSDLQIGLEVGREEFSKKYFDRYDAHQELYTGAQQSFWGAVAVKYISDQTQFLGLNLQPYASLMLGAGEIGPMGRFSAGVTKSISGSTSAFFGIEGATMLYNNKYSWYGSNKLGLTFGLNYSF